MPRKILLKRNLSFSLVFFFVFVAAMSPLKSDEMPEKENRELLAVDRFWSILERNPRRGTALDRVYGYYVDTGQIDQLIEKSTNLIEISPENAKAWLLHGLILVRRNNDLAAIEALQKSESLDVSDAMASFYLGDLLIAQGRLRDAAEALERALERKPARNDALMILQTLGRVYERFGDRDNSANVWEKMEEMFPNDLGILVRIAETLEEEGKFEEALSRYEKLATLAKNQNYARVRYTLAAADIKIRLGNKQEAIDDFEKLLEELASDNWLAESVRDRVERVFVRQADYAGLATYYRKRLDKHPNDLNTVHRLAVTMVRLSRTDEAKELLRQTLEKAPSNVKLRLALIDLLVNDRDFDEVEKQYAIIDELEPNNPDHISQWGLAVLENRNLAEKERKDRATDIWLRLVEARPNDMATLVMVADLLVGKDINDDAEVLYQRAVDLAPNDPTYREYLGFFYHRSERPDKAVATLKTIAEDERRTAANLSQLSNILYGLRYMKDAMEAVEEAAKLAPNDFSLQLRCCELLKENEWLDEAKRQLDVVQKLVETDDELEQYVRCEIELLGARNELPAKTSELARQDDKSAKDWWRLANYLLAAGRLDEATGAVDEAVKLEYPETDVPQSTGTKGSPLILTTAAEVYAKGYDQQKAAGIYEKLAALDASMRVEHLKKLAGLQRDLGQTDKAIETARLVMATGAGNAANSRFYADMLIAIGRRNDGIEALRRAVRLDPTDTTTLAALAEQLAQAGQINEAIELIWRIYDRTDDLQGKLSVVTKLSVYYQMSQQFGQLIERLRQGMHDVSGRREAAYCLAQAHASVGDYFAARNSLEILLTGVDEEKTSDTFLLEQLSKVAEQQGDMNAAVRYQEMLCDLSSLAQDNDRLLGLYYSTGQRDKASAMYSQKVFEQGELVDQINAIDKMLAREDYRPALALIERLEPKRAGHWELMYRKLQALYRLKEGNPDAVAKSLATLAVDDDAISLAAEKALEQAVKQAGVTPAMMRQMGYGYGGISGNDFYSGLNYGGSWSGSGSLSQWSLKAKDGETHSCSYFINGEMYDRLAHEKWNECHRELLPTLFRELLTYEDRYYYGYSQRQSGASGAEKPQYKPVSFGDAKFAAQIWRLKIAFDRDMEQLGLESPYAETKSQSTTTAEIPTLIRSACDCGPVYEDLSDEIEDDEEETDTAAQESQPDGMPTLAPPRSAETQPEKAKEKKKDTEWTFEHFNATLTELLAALPDDAQADLQDAKSLENRLQFEVFLGYWVALNRDLETVTPLKIHSTPETTARVESLAVRLAFVSDDPTWKRNLFHSILAEVSDAVLLKYYETLDLETRWAELPGDLAQDEQAHAAIRKLAERHVKTIRKNIAKQAVGADTVPLEKKIDWLVKTYVRECHNDTNGFHSQIMTYRRLHDLLKYSGRTDDAQKVEAAFEYAGNINPECFYETAATAFSPFDFLPTAAGYAVMNEAPFREFGRGQKLEQLRYWLRKGTRTLVDNIELLLLDDTPVSMQENVMAYLTRQNGIYYGIDVSPFDDLFGEEELTDLSRHELEWIWSDDLYSEAKGIVEMEGPNAMEVVTAALSAKSRRGLPVAPERSSNAYDLYQLLNPSDKTEKTELEKNLTMTREKLAALIAYEELLKSILDLRFETLRQIVPARNGFLQQTQLPPSQAQLRAVRQRVSLMAQAERYFNRYYDFDSDDIESLLSMFQSSSESSDNEELFDAFLEEAWSDSLAADLLLSVSKSGEGVEASDLQPRFEKSFDAYIAEKAASDNELEREIARAFLTNFEKIAAEHAARKEESPDDTKAIYAQLQDEHRQAKDDGQSLPDEKLLVLAVLGAKNKNYELTIECLDAMPLTAAVDIKSRESLFLTLYQQAVSNKPLRARAEEAIDRLLGYQLTTEELTRVRTLLKRFDRAGEADAIRDRLIVSATDARTQFTLLQELHRGGEKSAEQAVQYALKVFRSPAMMSPQAVQSDNINRELKNLAVNVLKKHGKLEEIIEQIEEQWKISPGATDIMVSLADIYSRNNREEDAKRIATEIGKQVPDDAQKMLEHAQLLRQVGMKDEAIDWTCKAIEKEPAQLFRDFWEHERTFRNAKQTPRLIELIRNMDAAVIEDNVYQVAHQLSQWLQAESTREMTLQLLDSLWNNEKASEKQRQNIREYLLTQMVSEPRKEFYPYLKTSMLEIIDASRKENDRSSQFEINTFADALLKAAKADGSYDALKAEMTKVVAVNETFDDTDKNMQAYVKALMLEAYFELKEKNYGRTCDLLTKLLTDERFVEIANSELSLFVDEIVNMPNVDNALIEMMIECLAGLTNDPEAVREMEANPYAAKPLIELYFKSDRPERGLNLAVSSVRQCLQYASRCGEDSPHFEINDTYFSIYELGNHIGEYARLMRDAGYDFELWLVYQAECIGQDWYENMGQHRHMQYYASQLKEPFEGLSERVTPECVAEHIGLLIPDLTDDQRTIELPEVFEDMIPTDTVNLAIDCKTVNATTGGAIRSAFRFLAEAAMQSEEKSLGTPMISSMLFDAIKVIAVEDKAKFDRTVETLDRSIAENPDEPTFVIARLFCATTSDDASVASEQMTKAADWVGNLSQEESLKFAYPVYLGFWIAVRETFCEPEKYDAERLAEPREKLLRWLDSAKSVGYNDDGTSSTEPQLIPNQVVNAMTYEMKRVLSDEWLEKMKAE